MASALRLRAGTVPPQVLLLGGIASVQFGAAFADTMFDEVGPGGVALLRVFLTALVLGLLVRPTIRGRTRPQLGLVAAYGLVLSTMNWTFYEALLRLPLGVTVTIEFCGPLAVAIAGSRRALDVLWVVLAAGGVAVLALRGGTHGVHASGVLLALAAAVLWATYILLTKQVGQSYGALEALALGLAVGTLVVLPAGLIQGGTGLAHPAVLGGCLAVALLSTIVPYSLELVALRRLSTAAFGLLMSLEPAVAALAGVLVLGQHLTGILAVAIAMVVVASVGSSLGARGRAVSVAPDP